MFMTFTDSVCQYIVDSNKVVEFASIFPILKTLMHHLCLVSKDNLTYLMLKETMFSI